MKPEKPLYGDPCNGCGECCEAELCPLAMETFPRWRAPCPALEGDASGPRICGLINNPLRYSLTVGISAPIEDMKRGAEVLCGAGCGCDAAKVDEPIHPGAREKMMSKRTSYSRGEIQSAKRAWRIG